MLISIRTLSGLLAVGMLGLSAMPSQACDRTRPVHVRYVYSTSSTLRTFQSAPVPPPAPAPIPAPVPVSAPSLPPTPLVSVSLQKPVAESEIAPIRPLIRPGEKVRVPLRFAGAEPGQASLKFGALKLNCEILEWTSTHAIFSLPVVELDDDVSAQVEVLDSLGRSLKSFTVTLESPENSVTVLREPEVFRN